MKVILTDKKLDKLVRQIAKMILADNGYDFEFTTKGIRQLRKQFRAQLKMRIENEFLVKKNFDTSKFNWLKIDTRVCSSLLVQS